MVKPLPKETTLPPPYSILFYSKIVIATTKLNSLIPGSTSLKGIQERRKEQLHSLPPPHLKKIKENKKK